MNYDIVKGHEEELAERISRLTPVRQLKAEEFEALAKYIIVADELQHEPFMSQDNNREGLGYVGEGESKLMFARLGHPAFLKSAILPFRKLWMSGEPCQFEKIRNLVFDVFRENEINPFRMGYVIDSYKIFYYEHHETDLLQPVRSEIKTRKIQTKRDLIDIWIYTHAVHTGKTERQGRFELKDFDEALRQAGRAMFESEFRLALRLLAYNSYLHFFRLLAQPAFNRLLELGYLPSFETQAALKFGPYPKDGENISLYDPFWHLDKESEEETFDRLIQRQDYHQFSSFFSGYFFARRPALNALKKYATFDGFLKDTEAIILDLPDDGRRLRSRFGARGDMNFNGGDVLVYENKAVYFGGRSRCFLSYYYEKFRTAFLEHRASIPECYPRWDVNYWGSG